VEPDRRSLALLRDGRNIFVVGEGQTKNESLQEKLTKFLESRSYERK
jgi:hypothetical protein